VFFVLLFLWWVIFVVGVPWGWGVGGLFFFVVGGWLVIGGCYDFVWGWVVGFSFFFVG